jgi:ferric-dicitrate binding protein FerR (iron transport regulator)
VTCALLALLLVGRSANAEPVGKVTDSTGPLVARTADQTLKVLVAGSAVEAGETFFTRADTYSQIRLADNSSIALGPDSELTIERYSTDSTSIRLIGGRVRIGSGLLGTHGSSNFILQAGDATLTVQRGTFIAEYIQRASSEVAWQDLELRQRRMAVLSSGDSVGPYRQVALRLAQIAPNVTSARAPGLYVQVLDGMVTLTNTGGSQNFAAGQFGYVPGQQMPPVILPNNPGMQFNPPPAFNTSTSAPPNSTPSSGKSGSVDCVVR